VIIVKDAPASPGTARSLLGRLARLHSARVGRSYTVLSLASDEDRAAAAAKRSAAIAVSKPDGFPETLDQVPAMLVICADLASLAATDRDLGRYQIAGGASIYPFVWNILLAARSRGLGGVMTTIATRNESGVREVLDIPQDQIVASIVALVIRRVERPS